MRSLRIFLPLAALVLALVAAGCGGSSSNQSGPTNAVAVVGSDDISRANVNDLFERAKRNYKAQKRAFPKAGSAEYQALQSQIVQYLVQVSEFDQQADDLKVAVTPTQVDARLKQ